MKNQNTPKSSERYGKLIQPIRKSLPVGLFSSQNSLFAQILSVKNTEKNSKSQKQKYSQTHFEAATQRAETPNNQNPSISFTTKYHLHSQSQKLKKKSNLINKESFKSIYSNLICQNKSADIDNLSSQNKESDDQESNRIYNNLKSINQQINTMKINQLSHQILYQCQKALTSNCEKLIEINQQKKKTELQGYPQLIKSDSSQSQVFDASGINLEKLLAEERKNRLLVEEQTSKIILSQESEIKSYIEKIKQLEQRLIEKNSWQK